MEHNEDEEYSDEWLEKLLDDDEMSSGEAGFMLGYTKAEEEGFG